MKVNFKSKKGKVISLIGVVGIVLVVLIGSAISKMTSAVETAMNLVQVETVQSRNLSETISLSGTAAGISRTNVTSKATAKVKTVNVQVGDQVKKGDVLCLLDSTDIEEQIATAEKTLSNETAVASNQSKQNAQALADAKADQNVQLSEAQNAINQAKEDLDAANTKLANDKSLLAGKQSELTAAIQNRDQAKETAFASPEDELLQRAYEQVAATAESKQAEVTALQEAVRSEEDALKTYQRAVTSAQSTYDNTKTSTDKAIASAQNTIEMESYQTMDQTTEKALKDLKEQLADCEVIAPCDGVVTAVNISVGDNNTPNAVIVSIEDTSSMKINATVNEEDILKIEEGMKAVVKTGATGEEEMEGTVTRVVKVKNESTAVNPESGTTSGYTAEITVNDSKLLVGMNAKVKVMIREKKDALAVPYDLIQKDEEGNTFVMVAQEQEDGTYVAEKCNVTAGEEVEYYTEITGGDLKKGDRLIYDTSIQEGDTFSAEQIYTEEDSLQQSEEIMEGTE